MSAAAAEVDLDGDANGMTTGDFSTSGLAFLDDFLVFLGLYVSGLKNRGSSLEAQAGFISSACLRIVQASKG